MKQFLKNVHSVRFTLNSYEEDMGRNGVRKNKDWYDDEEVLSFIQYLLARYTPVIKKDVITAFKEFIEKFGKLELIWYEWETIYKTGKSAEEITRNILYPSHGNTSFSLPEPLENTRWKPYVRKKGGTLKSLLRA
jgi:hypothetical protein